MCEMKQEGQFSKNNNLLQYAIQLVCVLKWNKRDSFQKKTTIYYSMLFNKRGIFQKTTIYYCMIFNLCAYWNETRGTVFKKKQHYSIEINKRGFSKKSIDDNMLWTQQEGQFSKNNNLLLYAIQLVCVLKWNKRDSFQKKTIYYSMLFNKRGSFQKTTIYYKMLFNLLQYWNETRGAVFKKQQFITVCYSTCVRKMKQEGQFSKKKNNLLQYAIQLVRIEMKQEG